MKIALGTATVGDYGREAIAAYYGQDGRASRETCREFLLQVAEGELAEREAELQAREQGGDR
jgi:hypothetical protein